MGSCANGPSLGCAGAPCAQLREPSATGGPRLPVVEPALSQDQYHGSAPEIGERETSPLGLASFLSTFCSAICSTQFQPGLFDTI